MTRTTLTLSQISQEFVYILSNIIQLEINPERKGETQSCIDIWIPPEDFSKSLDDFSERILMPIAYTLANDLKAKGAKSSYQWPLPDGNWNWSRQQYRGYHICCLMDNNTDVTKGNEMCFCILWSK